MLKNEAGRDKKQVLLLGLKWMKALMAPWKLLHAGVFLMLSTLRGIKTALFTLKRYVDQPRPFLWDYPHHHPSPARLPVQSKKIVSIAENLLASPVVKCKNTQHCLFNWISFLTVTIVKLQYSIHSLEMRSGTACSISLFPSVL